MTGRTGSYKYMSPETLQGLPANERIDQFSFAVLLWELFARKGLLFLRTHKMPDGRRVDISPEAWAGIVLRGGRAVIPDEWPPTVRSLIAQCWHSRPSERPAFTDVVAALQPLQEPERCTDPRTVGKAEEACSSPRPYEKPARNNAQPGCSCTLQ